ncbi:MAG: alpha/beta fold hydrolase, partial [Parvularculaceae bacterium]|nr:alpha/beta fold hydrolase [Parvularculaceae bacterium]
IPGWRLRALHHSFTEQRRAMTSTIDEFTRPLAGLDGAKPAAPAWFDWAVAQPSEERAVEVDGVTIRYSAWGDPARRGVVFVHGGRAHRNWWRPFAPHFAKHFRVVAFDLSGLGDSGWRARYSMTGFVDELFAVIDHAELTRGGRPIVVGHSFGGWVTLSAVEQRGERLSGAVIIDSPIVAPDADAAEAAAGLRKNRGADPALPLPPRPGLRPIVPRRLHRPTGARRSRGGGRQGLALEIRSGAGRQFRDSFRAQSLPRRPLPAGVHLWRGVDFRRRTRLRPPRPADAGAHAVHPRPGGASPPDDGAPDRLHHDAPGASQLLAGAGRRLTTTAAEALPTPVNSAKNHAETAGDASQAR